MTLLLPQYSPSQLLAIAEAVLRGDGVPHLTGSSAVGRDVTAHQEIQRELAELGSAAFARVLRIVAAERQAANEAWDRRLELVWTGPERSGAGTRDTAVVVRELFQTAEHDVIVAGYALFNARSIFEPLVERMGARSDLRVRIFANIGNSGGGADPDAVVAEFARSFLRMHWPPGPVPELYFDPRSIRQTGEQRAVLHAKCVVVDSSRTFITSANITEAAQARNLELGVVINDLAFGTLVRDLFGGLVESGIVRRVALR